MKYIMSGHSSFYIREGWLNKSFSKIFEGKLNNEVDPTFFSKNKLSKAIDELGVGSVMVESIRFWLDLLGVVTRDKNSIRLSQCAKVIFEKDKYLQNLNSLWLLHFNILNKKNEKAIIWDISFNRKNNSEFTKESLETATEIYCKENEIKFSKKSISDSINVFIKTYYNDSKDDNPEENITSPFVRLNYLTLTPEKTFKFRNIKSNEISEYLIYYILLEKVKESNHIKQITFNEALDTVNKAIKISYLELEKIIQDLEKKNEIFIDRAVGLDNITIDTDRYTELQLFNKILGSGN